MTHLRRRAVAFIAASLCTVASIYSVRFAWADVLLSRNDPASAAKAVALIPEDSRARYLKASILAADGTEDEADLHEATFLNPRDADAWMALGIEAESHGRVKEAEDFFLKAAAVDRTFKPAWTLANFYARQDREEPFWRWIRVDLEMAEPKNGEPDTFDLRPIFDLCWAVTSDANLIFQRALPRNTYVLGKYTAYLLDTRRYDAAVQAAEPIFPLATKSDLPVLRGLCELLLARDRPGAAVRAWNALAERKLIDRKPLDPLVGASLTNGDFRSAPLQFGFDWRFTRPGGVYDSHSAMPSCETFDFDGNEPEHAELMVQWFPVVPGRRYVLGTKYDTLGFSDGPNGLHWATYRNGNSSGSLPSQAESMKESGQAAFEFSAPAATGIDRLVLRYDRAPGTTRLKGTLKIYSASLQLLP